MISGNKTRHKVRLRFLVYLYISENVIHASFPFRYLALDIIILDVRADHLWCLFINPC